MHYIAKDLLLGMLETVPKIRFSAEKAHNHPVCIVCFFFVSYTCY